MTRNLTNHYHEMQFLAVDNQSFKINKCLEIHMFEKSINFEAQILHCINISFRFQTIFYQTRKYRKLTSLRFGYWRLYSKKKNRKLCYWQNFEKLDSFSLSFSFQKVCDYCVCMFCICKHEIHSFFSQASICACI